MMINATQSAIARIKALNASILRVQVSGGGCKGLQTKLSLETVINDNDKVLYQDSDVKVVADVKSASMLFGFVLDYEDGVNSKGFELTNPTGSMCGCGKSFG